jgi:hypothetical protein
MKLVTFRVTAEVSDQVDKPEAKRLMQSCLDTWPNDLINPHVYVLQIDEIREPEKKEDQT